MAALAVAWAQLDRTGSARSAKEARACSLRWGESSAAATKPARGIWCQTSTPDSTNSRSWLSLGEYGSTSAP